MTDRWTTAQLANPIRWVLSLHYAGGTFYMSSTPSTVDDGDGGLIVITDGLLEVSDTTEAIDLWATEAPRRSVGVTFETGLDVALLVEQGYDLAGAVAELAQLADGDTWDARRPFVVGRLVEPQYGGAGEGVRASVEQDLLSSDQMIEPVAVKGDDVVASLVATGVYASGVARDVTSSYIFGVPGAGVTPGSTAPYVATMVTGAGTPWHAYVLAGHAVTAATVTMTNTGDATTTIMPVLNLEVGGTVIALALEDTSTSTFTSTLAPVVTWDNGGGYIDEVVGTMLTAGDFLAWLLRLSSSEIDQGRVNVARQQLRAFQVGAYVDDGVSIADYIRETMLDVLPISIMTGPRGIYPLVWRWDATSEDAVAELNADEVLDVERLDLVTYEDGDKVENVVVLRYGWNPATEAYASEIWAVGDDQRPGGGNFLNLARSRWQDPILARSVARYGARRVTMESAVISDKLTAERVLAWRSRRWALPSRTVQYACAQRWAWIEPGDYVTVTDSSLAWTSKLCLVQERAWDDDGSVRYTLRVQETA